MKITYAQKNTQKKPAKKIVEQNEDLRDKRIKSSRQIICNFQQNKINKRSQSLKTAPDIVVSSCTNQDSQRKQTNEDNNSVSRTYYLDYGPKKQIPVNQNLNTQSTKSTTPPPSQFQNQSKQPKKNKNCLRKLMFDDKNSYSKQNLLRKNKNLDDSQKILITNQSENIYNKNCKDQQLKENIYKIQKEFKEKTKNNHQNRPLSQQTSISNTQASTKQYLDILSRESTPVQLEKKQFYFGPITSRKPQQLNQINRQHKQLVKQPQQKSFETSQKSENKKNNNSNMKGILKKQLNQQLQDFKNFQKNKKEQTKILNKNESKEILLSNKNINNKNEEKPTAKRQVNFLSKEQVEYGFTRLGASNTTNQSQITEKRGREMEHKIDIKFQKLQLMANKVSTSIQKIQKTKN